MTGEAQAVLREALSLPDNVRADIAAELLASLDPAGPDDPETVRSLWGQELERRSKCALAGESVGGDWTIVRQRIADELAG